MVSQLESGLEMHLTMQGVRSYSVRRGVEGVSPAPVHRLLGYTPAMRNFEMPVTQLKLDPSPKLFSPKQNQELPSPKRISKYKPLPQAALDVQTNTEDLKK